MLAQDIGRPVVLLQERCSGSYTRLRENRWAIKGLARAREVYETAGLARLFHEASAAVADFVTSRRIS